MEPNGGIRPPLPTYEIGVIALDQSGIKIFCIAAEFPLIRRTFVTDQV